MGYEVIKSMTRTTWFEADIQCINFTTSSILNSPRVHQQWRHSPSQLHNITNDSIGHTKNSPMIVREGIRNRFGIYGWAHGHINIPPCTRVLTLQRYAADIKGDRMKLFHKYLTYSMITYVKTTFYNGNCKRRGWSSIMNLQRAFYCTPHFAECTLEEEQCTANYSARVTNIVSTEVVGSVV